MLEVKWRQHITAKSHCISIAQEQPKDLPFLCFPSGFQSHPILSSKTTTAFDMEINLLIWSYILLWRDYTRYMTIRWSRWIDEIFSKHWHFCHAALSSPLKCQRQHWQDTLFFFYFWVNYIWMRMTHKVFGLVLHLWIGRSVWNQREQTWDWEGLMSNHKWVLNKALQ